MLRAEIWQAVELENGKSKLKHGYWRETADQDQVKAILDEVAEGETAWIVDDVNGDHGEIAEAIQVINLMVRRIQFVTGERDA
jgi:pyridoxal/pyridoxine/pyridoxamine kinase